MTLKTGPLNKKIVKTIRVYSNDPLNSVIILTISATVVNGSESEPHSYNSENEDLMRTFNKLFSRPYN